MSVQPITFKNIDRTTTVQLVGFVEIPGQRAVRLDKVTSVGGVVFRAASGADISQCADLASGWQEFSYKVERAMQSAGLFDSLEEG